MIPCQWTEWATIDAIQEVCPSICEFLFNSCMKPTFLVSVEEQILSVKEGYAQFTVNYASDNADFARQSINISR